MRRSAAIGVVFMLVMTLGGCQRAKIGARCHTKDWGDDGKNLVLQCKNGRWRRAMTKKQAAQIIVALINANKLGAREPATPAGVATEPSPPDNPARGSGASRSNPIALFADSVVGGQWVLRVESPSPEILTAGQRHQGSSATPAAGRVFVAVGASLLCGNGAETACTTADRSGVHMRLVAGDSTQYVYSNAPGYEPNVLTSDTQAGSPARYVGWATFDVPAAATGDLTLKVWVTGSSISPTYLRIR